MWAAHLPDSGADAGDGGDDRATLDTLSGGRFRLGSCVSGPQVSEGWHGVRFDKPLARTREYVDIVKSALRREKLRYEASTTRCRCRTVRARR